MSAGSKTSVGGYQKEDEETQFEIDDRRTVEEVKNAIYKKGYQPVFKDWQYLC
jgi:2-iminoacetate synthase